MDGKRDKDPEGNEIGRIKGVIQPLHQIVRNADFLSEDEGDDELEPGVVADHDEEEEWGGIVEQEVELGVEEDEEAPLAWDDIMGDDGAAGDESDEAVAEALIAPSPPKRELPVDEDDESEEEDHRRRPPKEPRMTTNKQKVHENFYTHANVKNKSRKQKGSAPGASGTAMKAKSSRSARSGRGKRR